MFRLIREWIANRQRAVDDAEEIRVWLRRISKEWRK